MPSIREIQDQKDPSNDMCVFWEWDMEVTWAGVGWKWGAGSNTKFLK